MESWLARGTTEAPGGSEKAAHDFGKVEATSKERYNGGARIKRMYGSSTVTRFYVHYKSDRKDPSKWMTIEGYGPTPGDRKTDAIRKFLAAQAGPAPIAAPSKVW